LIFERLSNTSKIRWFDEILGVAYRYYDLRMNIVPLFSDRRKAVNLWHDTIRWWLDPSIKVRFVEEGDRYWFIMGSDSQKPDSNLSFFKILERSENYDRFKKGHGGEAYLRLGVYQTKSLKDVKGDAVCNCGHESDDHDDEENDECLYEDCTCKKFQSFQVNLLKKKKTITDILFLPIEDIKSDPLSWNCINANEFSKE